MATSWSWQEFHCNHFELSIIKVLCQEAQWSLGNCVSDFLLVDMTREQHGIQTIQTIHPTREFGDDCFEYGTKWIILAVNKLLNIEVASKNKNKRFELCCDLREGKLCMMSRFLPLSKVSWKHDVNSKQKTKKKGCIFYMLQFFF